MDTPRRAARALRQYMQEVMNRITKGLLSPDSIATTPHLHFFRFIAPTIMGYTAPNGGHSWNSWGLSTRTMETPRDQRRGTQQAENNKSVHQNTRKGPCMWHVTSLTSLTTRRGEKFICRSPECRFSHATTTLADIVPAPTKEDIRKWDAGSALKSKVAAVAPQIQPEWI
jgi:hypothetical protein